MRIAGSEEFPDALGGPPALGPEIVPEGLPASTPACGRAPRLRMSHSGCAAGSSACCSASGLPRPVRRHRHTGRGGPGVVQRLHRLIEAARRRKPTTAAAEIQQNLLPPRVARVTGAQLAGGLLPSYEVGGDWFDYAENHDGSWLAIADASGTGPTAAGLGAAALGALRAARRSGEDLR